MKLSAMDLFCWKKPLASGAKYTKVLDFGTDGNALFEDGAVQKTAGAHGDDIFFKMFWCLWCSKAAADTSITVVWETSDNEPTADQANGDASKVDLFTKTITASELAKGAYPIANEPLPKGLKRFNRLKITGAAGSDSAVSTKVYPDVTAYLIDGRDEPIA